MTSLRFIGDLALWQGLLLVLAVGGVSWWLYWRESRELNGPARWLLPTLRSAAIALALLVLTAPVLHHRYREGKPGRLRILIDASRSMSVTDRQFDDQKKLQIARSLQWDRGPSSGAAAGQAQRDTGAAQRDAGEPNAAESEVGTPGSLENSSADLAPERAAIQRFDAAPRVARAIERLLGADDGVLAQVREDFEIIVERFDRQPTTLWESTLAESPPLPRDGQAWLPSQFGSVTALGTALASGLASDAQSSATAAASAAPDAGASQSGQAQAESSATADETLVVLSDGRNTAGVSPLAVAENLAAQHRPVYVIGYGGTVVPEDISLAAVEHPERIFERDMLRGTLVVNDRMQQAAPLNIKIQLQGETVWEETRSLAVDDRGRVEFAFPVKPLVEKLQKQASRSTEFSSVPLHLEASIEPQSGEADETNNARTFHVSVITKRSRLLLVDGRSRWETRYLHNMFERDPAWQVDIVLPDYRQTPPQLPQGSEPNQWPSTKERLLEYDLVILGEVPATVMPRESIQWLKSFVQSSGGGLIVIDGARQTLHHPAYRGLQEVLPIQWIEDRRGKSDPVPVRLTPAAKQLAAFELTPLDPAQNEEAWAELPPLHMTTAVKALPGSEVLATTSQDGAETPLMVTRQFGAGRVFYCGTDETWRWRYKVADTYHQRFWNQVARWVMRLPMSVQGQFVSLDSGKLVYQPGETVLIRSRLRQADGEPATGLAVEARVTAIDREQKDQVVAVVPLEPDAAIAGVYSGQIFAPSGGNYRVSVVAPGLTEAALAVHSEFSVVEPDGGEMDQLSCDEPLLMKLAQMTGGQYLSEERGGELVGLLRPLSRGKIIESDTLLWQSYWWFAPIVLLLSLEWWLRKRVGLL